MAMMTLLYKMPITASGAAPLSFETAPITTDDTAAVLVTLQVSQITPGASVTVQMQHSGDGSEYFNVGAAVVLGAIGASSTAIVAITTPYQKFMWGVVTLAPANSHAVISIYASLLAST